jgi:hypothetical protein
MCDIGYHICECGFEFKCDQSNYECRVMQGVQEMCFQCEQHAEEWLKEIRREEQLKQDRDMWTEQFNYN